MQGLLKAFPLLLILEPAAAVAHGQYPIAQDLHLVEGSAGTHRLVLETTFGLMTPDSAGIWHLTCEESISPGVKWWLVGADGRLGMAHAAGFASSTNGCDFTPAPEVRKSVRFVDRARPLQSGAPDVWLLMLDEYEPGQNVLLSRDRGATFEQVATPEGLLVTAIRADRHTAGRLTATAQVSQGRYAYLESADLGATWTRTDLEFPDRQGFPRVFAVTRDAVFLRRTTLDVTDLWRSADHGATWTKVLVPPAQPVFLSELADGELWTAAGKGHAFRSRDAGLTWTDAGVNEELTCLVEDGPVLYGCVFDLTHNRGLASSRDRGATWKTELTYDQIAGMADCPPTSTIGSVCGDYWPQVQAAMNPARPRADGGSAPTEEPGGVCSTGPVGLGAILALGLTLKRRRAS